MAFFLIYATCFLSLGLGRPLLLGCLWEPQEQSCLKAHGMPLSGDGEADAVAVFLNGPSG